MKRTDRRETIFRLLFMQQFRSDEEMPGLITEYMEGVRGGLEEVPADGRISGKEEESIRERVRAIADKAPEIDAMLDKVSKGWKTSRMGKVDLNILRLAVYEMLWDDEVPVGVAINEAVEMARKYGNDESPSFVNGILGQIARDLPKTDSEKES